MGGMKNHNVPHKRRNSLQNGRRPVGDLLTHAGTRATPGREGAPSTTSAASRRSPPFSGWKSLSSLCHTDGSAPAPLGSAPAMCSPAAPPGRRAVVEDKGGELRRMGTSAEPQPPFPCLWPKKNDLKNRQDSFRSESGPICRGLKGQILPQEKVKTYRNHRIKHKKIASKIVVVRALDHFEA